RQQLLDTFQSLFLSLLVLGPLVVLLFQPRLLLPTSQQPFGSRMEARISCRAIYFLQILCHSVPVVSCPCLFLKFSQAQNQRPLNGDVLFLIQTLDNGPGISTQRAEPMNQIAPHSRIIWLLATL